MDGEEERELDEESPVFDDGIREWAEKYAKELDEQIRQTQGRQKKIMERRAGGFWRAIGVVDGCTKAQAVAWIQEESGGGTGATMDDLGEVGGTVWGLSTACNTLSPWKTILEAVAYLVA